MPEKEENNYNLTFCMFIRVSVKGQGSLKCLDCGMSCVDILEYKLKKLFQIFF